MSRAIQTLEPSWRQILEPEFTKPYFKELASFINTEYKTKTVFPHASNIFAALNACPYNKVNVVILGQDPYHGAGEAHGLSFSVLQGVKVPPSLQNIFKNIEQDLGITVNKQNGDLSRWASQGVLLLNSVLTVVKDTPASHAKKGWEQLTSAIITALTNKQNIVYMLWGNYAKQKGQGINTQTNLVLQSPHPSPFSAHNGFFGNKHFSQCNAYLKKVGKSPINWT
jgi:uracil-DNA glycosylase